MKGTDNRASNAAREAGELSPPCLPPHAFIRAGQFCALITLLLGAAGLAGWIFDHPLWRSFSKTGPEMKFNTALALTITGAALLFLNVAQPRTRYRAGVGAGLVLLIAVLTLFQYIAGVNLGIDELVFADTNFLGTTSPGRMAWHSALNFSFLALSTLLLARERPCAIRLAQGLALAAAFFPVQALMGYAYRNMAVLGMNLQTGYMAATTATAFVCGALALLFHAPDRGVMAALTARTGPSAVFRRLLPILIVLPVILGWLALGLGGGAQRPPEYSVATLAVLTTVFFLALIWYNTMRLNRTEEGLRRSEERFSLAVRATNDAIRDWDLNTNAVEWNEAMQTLFGYTPNQVGPDAAWWRDLIHAGDRDRVVSGLHRVIDGAPSFWLDEYRYRRADGSYADVLDRGYVIRDATGKGVRMLGAMQDLTERKRAERATLAARAELQRHAIQLEQLVAERTAHLQAAITELESVSYSLSHDLRAPLRSMKAFTGMVLQDAGERLLSPEKEILQRTIKSAERLDKLIQDVLTFSRVSREKISLSVIDVAALIRQIIAERPELQPPNAAIMLPEPLPPVCGNEAYLTQCITNLLGNAVKFVAPGVQPRIQIRSEFIDSHVRLWFEDNGIGIPKEAHDRVFGMFERMHGENTYPGTGIGLAIVRRAAERMGGKVGVESDPPQGSRFWLLLPRA